MKKQCDNFCNEILFLDSIQFFLLKTSISRGPPPPPPIPIGGPLLFACLKKFVFFIIFFLQFIIIQNYKIQLYNFILKT